MSDTKVIDPNTYLCTRDYFLTGEEFCLLEDSEFGYLKTHPVPEGDLNRYYDSAAYISHSDSAQSRFEKLYQFVKRMNISYKFSKITHSAKGLRLLDFGCGTGDFLAYAKLKGMDVYGIEPNSKARIIAKKKIGFERLKRKKLEEFEEGFDVITLWHVLEHIPDLENFLPKLISKLKPGGELLIAVPNFKSYDAKVYGKFWAAYDVPRHLWHFSPESLVKLFDRYDMSVVKTYPLWFDSFYVSLLSEKFRGKKFGWIRAFFVAIFSNIVGIFSKNYSSLIYRVKNQI